MADDFEDWLDSRIVTLKDRGMLTNSAWELAAEDRQRVENERRMAGLARQDSVEKPYAVPSSSGLPGGDYYQFTWDGDDEAEEDAHTMFTQEHLQPSPTPTFANTPAQAPSIKDRTKVSDTGDGVHFRRESFRSEFSYGELSHASWEMDDHEHSDLEEEIDNELYYDNGKASHNDDNVFSPPTNVPLRTNPGNPRPVNSPGQDSTDSVPSSRRSTAGSDEGLILGSIVARPAYKPRRKPQRSRSAFSQVPQTDKPRPYTDKPPTKDRILLPMDEYEISMDEDEDDDNMLDVSLETADRMSVTSDTQPIVTVDQATLRQQWATKSRKSKMGIMGAVIGTACVVVAIVIFLIVKYAG